MRLLVPALAALARRHLRAPELAPAPDTPAGEQLDLTEGQLDLSSPDWLWDGSEDPVEESASSEGSLPGASVHLNVSTNSSVIWGPSQRVDMYGLFNTGTNLLRDMMWKNFPAGSLHGLKSGFPAWKHAKPTLYFKKKPYAKPQPGSGAVAIAIIRDPMSWLQSMWKAPYDLQGCLTSPYGGPYPDWTTRPCTMTCGADSPYCVDAHQGPAYFNSIEGVWNLYTVEYETITKHGYSRIVIVRYEDLVLQPAVEMKRIGDAIGAIPHAQVVHQHGAAKAHGMSSGRAGALAKLQQKSYLAYYKNGERASACHELVRTTMHRHNYHDCDGF